MGLIIAEQYGGNNLVWISVFFSDPKFANCKEMDDFQSTYIVSLKPLFSVIPIFISVWILIISMDHQILKYWVIIIFLFYLKSPENNCIHCLFFLICHTLEKSSCNCAKFFSCFLLWHGQAGTCCWPWNAHRSSF